MNKSEKEEIKRQYQVAHLRRRFMKNLQDKVDREDLVQWVKGFDTIPEKQNNTQELQEQQDRENHEKFLRRTMETDFGCK
jgi:hypothetical protein